MKTGFKVLFLVCLCGLVWGAGGKQESQTGAGIIGDMEWLAGTWESDKHSAVYTSPGGGVILGTTKWFAGDRVKFFEFEVFSVSGDSLVVTPYPGGKKSVSFKLRDYNRAEKRAVFVNPEHDNPKKLVYQRVAKNRLRIQVGDETLEPDKTFYIDLTLKK